MPSFLSTSNSPRLVSGPNFDLPEADSDDKLQTLTDYVAELGEIAKALRDKVLSPGERAQYRLRGDILAKLILAREKLAKAEKTSSRCYRPGSASAESRVPTCSGQRLAARMGIVTQRCTGSNRVAPNDANRQPTDSAALSVSRCLERYAA